MQGPFTAEKSDRNTGDESEFWAQRLSVGNSVNSLGFWTQLSGISPSIIYRRITNGDLPLQALMRSDGKGHILRIVCPIFIETISGGGELKDAGRLIFRTSEKADRFHSALFEDGGYRAFDDVLSEFGEREQERLLFLKQSIEPPIAHWRASGKTMPLIIDLEYFTDWHLLEEVSIRRYGVVKGHESSLENGTQQESVQSVELPTNLVIPEK